MSPLNSFPIPHHSLYSFLSAGATLACACRNKPDAPDAPNISGSISSTTFPLLITASKSWLNNRSLSFHSNHTPSIMLRLLGNGTITYGARVIIQRHPSTRAPNHMFPSYHYIGPSLTNKFRKFEVNNHFSSISFVHFIELMKRRCPSIRFTVKCRSGSYVASFIDFVSLALLLIDSPETNQSKQTDKQKTATTTTTTIITAPAWLIDCARDWIIG